MLLAPISLPNSVPTGSGHEGRAGRASIVTGHPGDLEGLQGLAVVVADVGLHVVASGCRSESGLAHDGADLAAHGALLPHAGAGGQDHSVENFSVQELTTKLGPFTSPRFLLLAVAHHSNPGSIGPRAASSASRTRSFRARNARCLTVSTWRQKCFAVSAHECPPSS